MIKTLTRQYFARQLCMHHGDEHQNFQNHINIVRNTRDSIENLRQPFLHSG